MSLNPEGLLGSYLCDVTLPALLITCHFLFCGQESKQRILPGEKDLYFLSFLQFNFLNSCLSYVPISFLPPNVLLCSHLPKGMGGHIVFGTDPVSAASAASASVSASA